MKTKISCLLLLLSLQLACSAQKDTLIEKLSDVRRLKSNTAKYVGQPLSTLLADIRLPILSTNVLDRKNETSPQGSFYFKFWNEVQQDSARRAGANPVGIIVYVKEPFIWDAKTRYEKKDLSWKPEDTQTFGHLTIERIRVLAGSP